MSSDMDQTDSVIAACIQRFRHEAPAPSESRSRVPAGKFWWLDPSAQNDLVGSSPTNVDSNIEGSYREKTSSKSAQILLLEQRNRLGSSSGRETAATENSDEIRSSAKKLSDRSNQHQFFDQDLKFHDVDDVLNLDNYAEKLLQKCDLLLSGYDSTTNERSSKSPNWAYGKKISDRSKTRPREEYYAPSRHKDTVTARRPMALSESQETMSSDNSDSKSEEASDEISANSSNTDRLLQILSSESYKQPFRSKMDLDDSDRPVSPLRSSIDASAPNWTGQHSEDSFSQLSLHGKQSAVDEGHSVHHNLKESLANQNVREISIKSADSYVEGRTRTRVKPDNIKEITGNLEPIPEQNKSSSKKNCLAEDYDTLEPSLSESIVFPTAIRIRRDERHGSGSDSFLYVSSSSEMDVTVRTASTARLRNRTVSGTGYEGSASHGYGSHSKPLSLSKAIQRSDYNQVIKSLDVNHGGDNSNSSSRESSNSSSSNSGSSSNSRSGSSSGSSEGVDALLNSLPHRHNDNHQNGNINYNDNNDSDNHINKYDHDSRSNTDNNHDNDDNDDDHNYRDDDDTDESLQGSRLLTEDEKPLVFLTECNRSDCDPVPVTSEFNNVLAVSTPHTVSPYVPLLESDVASYLDDEITMLLWQRLCSVRSRICDLTVHDP